MLINKRYVANTLLISFTWLVCWFFLFNLITHLLASYLLWNFSASNTILQCLISNFLRVLAFAIFLYIQLGIIGKSLNAKFKFTQSLNFFNSFNIDWCRDNPISLNIKRALIATGIWTFYYFSVSIVFLFEQSHFMGDCDYDLECNCNNFLYITPFLIIFTVIFSTNVYSNYALTNKEQSL